MRRRSFWGWGFADETVDPSAVAFAETALAAMFGRPLTRRTPPEVSALALRAPRITAPASLASITHVDPETRARLALGRSYRDLARSSRGMFPNPPDAVLRPRTADEVRQVIDFAGDAGVAVVPFGGGSSVAGGVEPDVGNAFRGAITIDMSNLGRVLEIDPSARAAHVEGGAFGPAIEDALRPHGLSLRHYPQSFEHSTLGGWIVTRAGGHFATVFTHIDEMVEAVSMVTPSGTFATRRLPASGAGPSADRFVCGSEGTLGIVTSAWVRLFSRPRFRATVTARAATLAIGFAALRALGQSGLHPHNARLVDPVDAMAQAMDSQGDCLLFLAFEAESHDVSALLDHAITCVRDAGATVDPAKIRSTTPADAGRNDTADAYRKAFFRGPYLRDELVLRDVFVETYETACVWSRLEALDRAVREAVARVCEGPHLLGCRVTHLYADGCAPYYTLVCPARVGAEEAQWHEVKRAITDAVVANGGTSTHHHAVGRDVVPWFEAETSPLWRDTLAAAKRTLDPSGIMNPGVLLAPARGARS